MHLQHAAHYVHLTGAWVREFCAEALLYPGCPFYSQALGHELSTTFVVPLPAWHTSRPSILQNSNTPTNALPSIHTRNPEHFSIVRPRALLFALSVLGKASHHPPTQATR